MKKRILIVGAGGIGLKHMRAMGALDVPPRLAVIEPRPDARARAAELGVEVLDSDWEGVDLSRFDGVVICAPAPMHVPMLARCLSEGVPVLSEKPLSQAWDGVEELVALADKEGAPPSGVAYTRRYVPAHRKAQELVTSGELGPILAVRVLAGQPFTSYRPDYRQTYYASRAMGGGCTLDFASHFVDLVQFYAGPINSICGYPRHLTLEGVEVEDTVAMSFEFMRNGALGCIHINQWQPVYENIMDFCSPEACLRVMELPGIAARIFRKGAADWEDIPLPEGDYLEGLRLQDEAFLDSIDGKAAMSCSVAEAAHTLRLCLDIIES